MTHSNNLPKEFTFVGNNEIPIDIGFVLDLTGNELKLENNNPYVMISGNLIGAPVTVDGSGYENITTIQLSNTGSGYGNPKAKEPKLVFNPTNSLQEIESFKKALDQDSNIDIENDPFYLLTIDENGWDYEEEKQLELFDRLLCSVKKYLAKHPLEQEVPQLRQKIGLLERRLDQNNIPEAKIILPTD